MLFIDFSSAFNTIIPDILVSKLTALGLSPSICTRIKNFLSNRPQTVKLGPHLSSTITLSTGPSLRATTHSNSSPSPDRKSVV